MENEKMNMNLEEMEEQKKPVISKGVKREILKAAVITAGCLVSYKLGALKTKKDFANGMCALCLVDPTFEDHFFKAIENTKKAING